MVTLTVRKLDDNTIERLKARARARRHSLEAELRDILTEASRQPLILDAVAEADRIAAMTPGKALPKEAASEVAPATSAPMQMGGEP